MTGPLLPSAAVALALTIFQTQIPRAPSQPGVPPDPTRAVSPDQPPVGRRVQTQDGDLIVVEHGARVRVLHRREGVARVIADPDGRYVVVLADFIGRTGEPPDGRVDRTYSFSTLMQGRWPFDARWEGPVVFEEYGNLDTSGPRTIGIVTPGGLVQFIPGPDVSFKDPVAVATIQALGTGSGHEMGSFDEVERRQVAMALENASRRRAIGPGTLGVLSSQESSSGVITHGRSGPTGAVRVGGSIKPPVKVHHVDPVYPETARAAHVTGVVVLEVTIGEDGRVQDARVLRSIPLLDQAALEAVRQWRFEPTQLEGRPVPVVITATVSFNLQ